MHTENGYHASCFFNIASFDDLSYGNYSRACEFVEDEFQHKGNENGELSDFILQVWLNSPRDYLRAVLLRAISGLSIDIIPKCGIAAAMAGLNSGNALKIEAALSCFECWDYKDVLPELKSAKIGLGFLLSYRDAVVSQLEGEYKPINWFWVGYGG